MNKRVYLDYNATTPLHPEVKKTIIENLDLYGNASSMHSFGREVREKLETARADIAHFINAQAQEVIFVGSGSEANNTVINTVTCQLKNCKSGGSCSAGALVISSIEHPCIIESANCAEQRGRKVFHLTVDKDGLINISELENILKSNCVSLVSVMTVNNETGAIQDIKKITELAHKYNALVHTDAIQAVGKMEIDVKELDVDFLSFSAHKIYGPKGIGALYIKKGIPFCPLIYGGHQEMGRRAGTENSLGIVAFHKAILMRKEEMHNEHDRVLKLRERLRKSISENIPDTFFNGTPENTMYNCLNVSFAGAEGEAMLLYLDLEGIAVSTGSACSSQSLEPSHVLLATGIDLELAHGSLRISLGRDTTQEEIDYVSEKLPGIIEKIRKMSTTYKRRKA